MKLLLTSAGITNASIRAALLELLGKPIEECTALVISTASYPLRHGPQLAWSFIAGEEPQTPMAELGWTSVGVLELTALPSLPRGVWLREVEEVFASWTRPVGGEGLGVVDFEIFPHLDNPDLPENTTADAERWAAGLTGPGYAIDDNTAIKVVDGVAEVISEGNWHLFGK